MPTRVFRWHLIVQIIGVVVATGCVVGIAVLVAGIGSFGQGRGWDLGAAGLLLLVMLGGYLPLVESIEVRDQGLCWRILGYRTTIGWHEIQRLAWTPLDPRLRIGYDTVRTDKRPVQGKTITIFQFIRGAKELRALIILRAGLVRVSPENADPVHERVTGAEELHQQLRSSGRLGR